MICVQAHCLTQRIHDIDLLTLDSQSVAEVGFVCTTLYAIYISAVCEK